MNSTNLLDLIDHINMNLMFKPEGPTCMNNSVPETILFEKLHNIKLSHSMFRVTTLFQFASTEAALQFYFNKCMIVKKT